MERLIVGTNCTDPVFVTLMDETLKRTACKVHNIARYPTVQRNKGMGSEIKQQEKLHIFLSA